MIDQLNARLERIEQEIGELRKEQNSIQLVTHDNYEPRDEELEHRAWQVKETIEAREKEYNGVESVVKWIENGADPKTSTRIQKQHFTP